MESVLKYIAKSANLDRVLFTPALRKLFFNMAVASGGTSQFKHAEGIRHALSFAADKADDKKSILVFCTANELMSGYDLMIQIASKMLPVVVLALRSGVPETGEEIWSYLNLRDTGWIQFFTHTLQETYDHLALSYHMNTNKKAHMPTLILHSSMEHDSLGEVKPREDMDMGNPLTGLQSARAEEKMSFEKALSKIKQKEEKLTLRQTYELVTGNLREIYQKLDYPLPEKGLPLVGDIGEKDSAILSLFPTNSPADAARICRPLCYRPFAFESAIEALKSKKKVAIVEPHNAPGTIPTFYSEICTQLGQDFDGQIQSITLPPTTTSLTSEDLDAIEAKLKKLKKLK